MYFPKSQIETNLYSNGELTILTTGVPYVGFYWSTSTGKYFAGKSPNSIDSIIELVQYSENAASNVAKFEPEPEEKPYYNFTLRTLDYLRLKDITKMIAPTIPKYIPPSPSLEDYKIKEFNRYFCKKINEPIFIEISVEEYLKLKNKDKTISFDLYNPFILTWVISGNKEKVALENKSTVFNKESNKNYIGLSSYLKNNYIQLYSLYTPGGEFLLPNGKDYVGLYHIHPDKGPMVGRRHVPYFHQALTPVNISPPSTEVNNPQNQSSPPINPPSADIYNGSSNTPGGY